MTIGTATAPATRLDRVAGSQALSSQGAGVCCCVGKCPADLSDEADSSNRVQLYTRGFARAVAAMLLSAAHAADKPIQRSSLCELAKSGKELDGQAVRVSAVYVTDLMHGSVLKDRHCSADG